MDKKGNLSASIVSYTGALLIPLVIAAYWPLYSISEDAAVVLLRPAIFGASLLLALLCHSAPATSAELQAACVLGLLCTALLVPSITATDVERAFGDWAKLLILCGMSLFVARALRNQAAAKAFGVALIAAGLLVGVFIVLTYVRVVGLALPTYKLTREFKGIAERSCIPLNAIPFTSVFSFLAGMCLLRTNWLLSLTGFVLFLICSVLTGSRAPLGLFLLSALALACLNAFRSRRLSIRLAAYLLAAAFPVAIAVLAWHMPFKQVSSLTEGRWDLWYVACKKFVERPILGLGYGSWQDDLVSMLPGAYALTSYMAKNIVGGYHNEYLGLLAEQGLIGFVPAMVLVCFLFSSCWKCAFRSWSTRRTGQWPLFACIFLLLRAGVEIPGLFGYGSEPADYLAYIFLAVVISRFSCEEDFLRANTSSSCDGTYENTRQVGDSRRPPGRDVPVGLDRSYV